MIYHKIFITEHRVLNVLKEQEEKIKTINRIKGFLSEVDNSSEFVVASSIDDLNILLADLKGECLSMAEEKMLEEIFNVDREGNDEKTINN